MNRSSNSPEMAASRLLWQANRTHSPLAARVIEIAVEVADKIAKHHWRRGVSPRD